MIEELAATFGIVPEFTEIGGAVRRASPEDLAAVLTAMGLDVGDEAAMQRELYDFHRRNQTRLIDPVIVFTLAEGPGHEDLRVELRIPARLAAERWAYELQLEGGPLLAETVAAEGDETFEFDRLTYVRRRFTIALAPPGYHRLRVFREDSLLEDGDFAGAALIVCPPTCHVPPPEERRRMGAAVQLYALRSGANFGSGELTDLEGLLPWARRHNYEVLALSPVHALYPANPRHVSPYSPSNRRFLNIMYMSPRRFPEWHDGLDAAGVARAETESRADGGPGPIIDYAQANARRLACFEKLYAIFEERGSPDRREAFEAYRREQGEALRHQALFDVLYEHFVQEHEPALYGWRNWPASFRRPDGPAVRAFAEGRADRLRFYEFLYWNATVQLDDVRRKLLEHGVRLNLDLAVGADASGAETWSARSVYALHASAGAPPDPFSPDGQNWGLAPMIPHQLREEAYRPFIEVLRANLPEDGVLRLDHAMQLFRLYWACDDGRGAYVSYPYEELLAILCLESRRRRCMIIGEDLGTVPENVRAELARRQILSWRVAYFEKDSAGEFVAPEAYPENSIATLNTHDLPTLRGYWNDSDIQLRENLGKFTSVEAKHERQQRRADRRRLLAALVEREYIDAATAKAGESEFSTELRDALHAYLADAGSQLRIFSLHDLLHEHAQPNLPGTVHEYPNWSLSYSKSVEELAEN